MKASALHTISSKIWKSVIHEGKLKSQNVRTTKTKQTNKQTWRTWGDGEIGGGDEP